MAEDKAYFREPWLPDTFYNFGPSVNSLGESGQMAVGLHIANYKLVSIHVTSSNNEAKTSDEMRLLGETKKYIPTSERYVECVAKMKAQQIIITLVRIG